MILVVKQIQGSGGGNQDYGDKTNSHSNKFSAPANGV